MNTTHSKTRSKKGFNIVELIIVVIVIAILTAITVVGYNLVRANAIDTAVKTEAKASASALETYRNGQSAYPTNCATAGAKVGTGRTLTCNVSANGQNFCASVTQGSVSYVTSNLAQTPVLGSCSGTESVPVGTEFTEVSTGEGTSCGIAGGKAYCWGVNWGGMLGNGSMSDSLVPEAVVDTGVLAGKTVTDIAVGDAHGCAVASGQAFCWGEGSRGQLGNGALNDSLVPVAVSTAGVLAGKTVTKIAVNGDQTCLIANGLPYCMGDTYNGALGNGVLVRTSVSSPVAVTATGVLAGKTVTDISVGGYYAYNACVIASGQAFCWGSNGWGSLGNGTTTNSAVPVAVSTAGVLAGKTVTAIDIYEYQTCAVANGQAYCWGGNGSSQLGNNSTTDSYVPVAVYTGGVLAGKTVTSISPGDYFSCAIADGKPYCWGDNQGNLGNGTTVDSMVPVAVNVSGVLAGRTAVAISSGYNHVCVLADSRVSCWGDSVNWWPGSLGNGSSSGSTTPTALAPLH